MSELNIYLQRHGQTTGNVNREAYLGMADHAIPLTEYGKFQAQCAGEFLTAHLRERRVTEGNEAFGKIHVWYSPYYRTRNTAFCMLHELGKRFDHDPETGILSYQENPFLIEQKAGLFDGHHEHSFDAVHSGAAKDYRKHIKFNGRSYAIMPNGESRLDVAVRLKDDCRTILDDYRKKDIRNVIIVTHGVTLRAFVMAWMDYPIEWLDAEKNPGNCWIRRISGTPKTEFRDHGYIFGEDAPLNDPSATQRELKGADEIYMLTPHRSDIVIPKGVKPVNPFDYT